MSVVILNTNREKGDVDECQRFEDDWFSEIDMYGGIISQEGLLIGSSYINKDGKTTITLLDRPKLPLPTS